jgi:beta-mannosidase
MPPTRTVLDTDWVLRCTAPRTAPGDGTPVPAAAVRAAVPAQVPGAVHTDLLAAGLIPDPYLDRNEAALQWIGESDWSYSTSFEAPAPGADRVDLVFEGLDTVAEVVLAGHALARTANMHRTYRFDVTDRMDGPRPGLEVRFGSAAVHARAERERLGPLPAAYAEPFNAVRKMACNFGWDWGPTLVTAGIWRPVHLHAWNTARLAAVRPQVTLEPDGPRWRGRLAVEIDLERAGADRAVDVRASVAGRTARATVAAGATRARLDLVVDDVRPWWPRGHGEQPLYDLDVTLARAGEGTGGPELDRWTRRVGFRSVELDVTPDAWGTPFFFRVNGRPIQVLGANWIPDDCFPARVTPRRCRDRVDQAVAAGVNLLRVWGGGLYESDEFYSICDEYGVLTWQDFLFACAAYPEDPGTAAEVEAEARDNVTRLAGHPSLVLWNGNNENFWGHADWGWAEELDGRPWGAGYYTGLLPAVVAELDPATPYWPGSPWSGRADRHPNDPAHGNSHIWDVWNEVDYSEYRSYRPRFVSEFGYQGPPAWSTLTRAVHDDPLTPASPGMSAHQKAIDGNEKLRRGLAAHFEVPDDVTDWHFLAQVNQARAVRLGVEHLRSLWPLCAGAVVWQLNDCWPVTSWAAIDGDGRLKPLWYALRAAYAPRLVAVQPDPAGLVAVVMNDTDEPWTAHLSARRVTLDGRTTASEELVVEVEPRHVARRSLGLAAAAQELVVVDGGPRRALWAWAEDKDLALPAARFEAVAAPAGDGHEVTVTARTLLRDLCLFPDRLVPSAEVDDLLVTLLPGETHTFRVRGSAGAGPGALEALVRPPVLRCVNDRPVAGVRDRRSPA